MPAHTNRLINSTSPYLLQHAHNPVQWFEWGVEALRSAAEKDKPILVSIGYSSCHWCHVMERESFESEAIAAIMNEHFICIKVDREERPDIDQIYMEAVQVLGVNGGWPLNVFLTPDQKPFFGGTYFPPKNWSQLLLQINKAFGERRIEINQSSQEIASHLATTDLRRFADEGKQFHPPDLNIIFSRLEEKFDATWGGLDKAPKFIMPDIWKWLLRYHSVTKNPRALQMVTFTLRQIAFGGIYDQVGGGFSRYSVDGHWFAPHFEKMLYDNAQLLSLYADAFRASRDPLFRDVIYETTEWLTREMMHPQGGFYSALDADSEGVEGKFYTWTHQELKSILSEGELLPFLTYYHATEDGNWEHERNILHRADDSERIEEGVLRKMKSILLTERDKRIRPGLDDKILTGWNAMLIQGFLDCYNALSDPFFYSQAVKAVQFVESNLMEGQTCYRAFKGKRSNTEGFLEDYAFLIRAYITFYQSTFDEQWLHKANELCSNVVEKFWDDKEGYFYFTSSSAEKLIARKKEIFDNVISSSNAIMARNLFHLGKLLENEDWLKKSSRMVSSLKNLITSEPAYMSCWGLLALEYATPFPEVAIAGPDALVLRKEMAAMDILPGLMMGGLSTSTVPLMRDKFQAGKTMIHVCHNKSCQLPVGTVAEAVRQMTQASNT